MGFFTAVGIFVIGIIVLLIFCQFVEDSMDERLKRKERELQKLEVDLNKRIDGFKKMYRFAYPEDCYPPIIMKERIRG